MVLCEFWPILRCWRCRIWIFWRSWILWSVVVVGICKSISVNIPTFSSLPFPFSNLFDGIPSLFVPVSHFRWLASYDLSKTVQNRCNLDLSRSSMLQILTVSLQTTWVTWPFYILWPYLLPLHSPKIQPGFNHCAPFRHGRREEHRAAPGATEYGAQFVDMTFWHVWNT